MAKHQQKSRLTGKRVMAWIGGVTAVLTLAFGLQKLVSSVGHWRAQKQRTAELLAVATLQRESQHYPEAWATLKEAEQVNAKAPDVLTAQEDLAMLWLRNAHVQGEQTFTELVRPLLPVLERGTLRAQGQRKADLLAHSGWADFLRWRDGARDLSVDVNYRRALEIDPANPFAHAMWGHWILETDGDVAAAHKHFDAALTSGREHAYVRSMQIAALSNVSSVESEAELLRVANEMRQKREPIDTEDKNGILWLTCYSDVDSAPSWARSPAQLPTSDELATLRWLFEGNRDNSRRDTLRICEARAYARGGDNVRALALLRDVATTAPGDGTRWEAQQAAKRLEKAEASVSGKR